MSYFSPHFLVWAVLLSLVYCFQSSGVYISIVMQTGQYLALLTCCCPVYSKWHRRSSSIKYSVIAFPV